MRFKTRFQAGQILAGKLKPWASSHPLVLALPRGGVPGHSELALGAIAERREPSWNNEVFALVDLL